MRYPWLILSFILLPFISLAQNGTISGVIINAESKKPLARASVFLSNSSVGTATAENGTYSLYDVRPGQYTLVVSILGFEQYNKTILVGREPIKLDIELKPKPMMLREVVISTSEDWKKNFEAFRKQFIGTDENAKYCTILNPHILNITFNQTKQILHADGDEFLIVENKALGYRIKFLLNEFDWDKIAGIISTDGPRVFEDLPGSESQKKKWHEKREAVYYGSSMHFLRSLYKNKLTEEGFEIKTLNRYRNLQRPSNEVIHRQIEIYKTMGKIDSANYWIGLANAPQWTNESLVEPSLHPWEICYPSAEQPGLYNLKFRNYLYVIYKNKTDDTYNKDIYRPLNMSNYAVSVVTLGTPYAVFDMNGIIHEGGTLFEGTWSMNRLSDLLPYDYVPDKVAN